MNDQEAELLAMRIIDLFQKPPPQTAADVMTLRGILVEMLKGKEAKQEPPKQQKKGFNWTAASNELAKRFG